MEFVLSGIWCLCLGCDQELVAKHELLEQSLSHVVLRELVEHRSKYRGAFLVRNFKSSIKVVCLRVSLVYRI